MSHSGPPPAPVVVFHTSSNIEASVVMALLDSHGIESFRISGNPQAIWPMSVNALGADPDCGGEPRGRRRAPHHRAATARTWARALVRLEDACAALERRIGYRFKDRGLLEQALTHRSRAAEDVSGAADNESLEFLGDAVLGFVVADRLFHQFPEYNEGQKSKIKAAVVSTQSLARHAEAISLGDYLLLGRGEEKTGGRAQVGAAGRHLRGARGGDLSRRRARGRGHVPAPRAEGRHRRRQRAAVRAGLQVGAAGARAGAGASAAGVSRVG